MKKKEGGRETQPRSLLHKEKPKERRVHFPFPHRRKGKRLKKRKEIIRDLSFLFQSKGEKREKEGHLNSTSQTTTKKKENRGGERGGGESTPISFSTSSREMGEKKKEVLGGKRDSSLYLGRKRKHKKKKKRNG